jgi:formate dehydrogenase beta subunit
MNHPVNPITPTHAQPGGPRRHGASRGRRVDEAMLSEVHALLGEGEGPRRRDLLVEHLHKIQDLHGHLAEAHLAALAQEMGLPRAEVLEVAAAYPHFDIVREGATPPAAVTVRVCDGLSCTMADAGPLLERLPALLGPAVRVIASPCMGRCEQAPAVMVGQNPVAPARLEGVSAAVTAGLVWPMPRQFRDYIDYEAYRAAGGYRLYQECATGRRDAEAVLAALGASGLRGLGGGGYPAADKWRAVRAAPAPRFMAVNINEGEPGTFKDRVLLESDPHRFLEGLLIAAWAVDAAAVYLYLRDDYHGCREVLAQELGTLRQELPATGLPEIHLRRGGGAYICGEESAMIDSIEGRRGLPRQRPPGMAHAGLWGHATLEHNFETLYWVRELLARGGDWFAAQGRHGCHGLRHYSVSGRVKAPGVKRAPAGITLRELVDEYCGGMQDGHTLYAYLPGGASGGILPAALADLPLGFDRLQPYGGSVGSAGVIVLSDHDSAAGAARQMMRFFKQESCGQCAPCHEGTAKASVLIGKPAWDAGLLGGLSAAMHEGSMCGLGRAAPQVFDSVLRHFPHEVG